ncbi:MAG TPA: cytochrome c [Longimicrobiales bacterium]|nr:cytochrome c [Longimicrobiales bacterium]
MSVVRSCLVLLLATALPLGAQQEARHEEGEQIFSLVCAMCHSVNPPAKAAPPISHAAAYYIRRHDDRDAAVLAMVSFLKEPAAERSVLPPHAVERFGLMPPQVHLSDAQLRAVARYALSLADTVHVGPGHRHGGGTP